MRFAAILAAGLFSFIAAHAAPIEYFEADGVAYDAAIPTPEAFLGHELGEKPVRHDRMVAYLEKLSELSPRITHQVLGYSHEGRPILGLVVTSEKNHAKLDAIRAAHLARLDPENPDTDGPAVVWLNYGVHGAESSGMDAAIPVLRHLAAAKGAEIEKTLDETVIVMVAIFNPDGHSRRINHVYQYLPSTEVTNPDHEVHQLWTAARVNHYWFDLNRDWLLLTQPESRAWIDFWHAWKPNVSADFHEMGSDSSYYFHPGEPKRRNPLIPDAVPQFLAGLAEGHREALDRRDELYFSEEGFDNFYIGKGSTYPSINGSVGILFEAGAARGGAIEGSIGVRRYEENIRLHFDTSLSTIEGARKAREELLGYQRGFFASALAEKPEEDVKGYVFTTAGDSGRLFQFLMLLKRHDVSVQPLTEPLQIGGKVYPAKTSYIVPLRQPQRKMIRGLFDRVTEFEETIFYDVSGWTMSLAYDLDYASLDQNQLATAKLGAPEEPKFRSAPAPAEGEYGYLLEWTEYYAPRALGRLQKAGVRARALLEPKRVPVDGEEQVFERGTLFVPLSRQDVSPRDIHRLMREIARKDAVRVHPVTSGEAAGSGDLGARDSVKTVPTPKILLVFNDGVRRYDAGEVWHLLDKEMQLPVILRDKGSLGALDLNDYTHLIAPGGAKFDEQETDRIKAWVRAGGVLITLRDASVWAESAFADYAEKKKKKDDAEETPRIDYAEIDLKNAEHVIGGAVFSADLDITHPLGFGYHDRSIAFLKNTTHTLSTPKNPFATVAKYPDAPLLSGYASRKRIAEIGGTPALVADRYGAGAVVMFADNPAFRATFRGDVKLFMNAIYFAPLIDRARLD